MTLVNRRYHECGVRRYTEEEEEEEEGRVDGVVKMKRGSFR